MTNLQSAVLEILKSQLQGYTKDDAEYWIANDAICESGAVSSLISYSDTTKFFDAHEEEILELATKYEHSPSIVGLDIAELKNNLARFAFEELAAAIFYTSIDSFEFDPE